MPARLETYPFRKDRLCWWWRATIRSPRSKIAFAQVLQHDPIGPRPGERAAALPGRQGGAQRPLAAAAGKRAAFDPVCRLVECRVGIGIVPDTTARRAACTMAIKRVALTDAWAERELTICIRSLAALPAYAQELVQHLRSDG